jgi:RNA polymerase sigma-70 factor (ECF subfamily)
VLHDVFGFGFEEVAGVVGRTPAAVRQLASRARRHVEEGRPRFPPTRAEQERLVTAFVAACGSGDMQQLVALLDPGVVWRADGGGKVTAARPAVDGARNVARWLVALARRPPRSLRIATVNGAPGLVMRDADGVLMVIAFTIDAGRITALDVMRNPDKLGGMPEPG